VSRIQRVSQHAIARELRAIVGTLLVASVSISESLSSQNRSRGGTVLTVDRVPFFDTSKQLSADSAILLGPPMGMTRLRNGVVVVADNKATTVRFFSAAGNLVSSVGRYGSGPREFQLVQLVGHCGTDTLLFVDEANMRFSFLAHDGRFLGTRKYTVPLQRIDCGLSGTVVEARDRGSSLPVASVAHRGTVSVSLRSFRDSLSMTVLEVAGGERQRWPSADGPRPLGKKTVIAVGKDVLFIGTGDSAKIRVFDLRGREQRSIPLAYRAVSIKRSDIQRFLEYLAERNPGVSRGRIEDTYGRLEYPETFPLHGEMLVDPIGRLWVEEYRPPWAATSRWSVVGSGGAVEAVVMLPDRFRLAEVGRDYLLGSWRDEDDVDHVRAYRFAERKLPE